MREDKGQPPGRYTKAFQHQRTHPWPPQRRSVSPLFFPSTERCWGRGRGARPRVTGGWHPLPHIPQCYGGLGPARGDGRGGWGGVGESLTGTNHSESRSSHLARPQEIGLSTYTSMRESQLRFVYLVFIPAPLGRVGDRHKPRRSERAGGTSS